MCLPTAFPSYTESEGPIGPNGAAFSCRQLLRVMEGKGVTGISSVLGCTSQALVIPTQLSQPPLTHTSQAPQTN